MINRLIQIRSSLSKPRMDVLVLGNGPQILDINFELIKPEVITLGVNRIWLKFVPNYLFFHDPEILYEIEKRTDIDFSNTVLIVSDWSNVPIDSISSRFKKVINVKRVRVDSFPDSVSTCIQIFSESIFKNKEIYFYIAGVNLKWTDPSHFWKKIDYSDSLNKNDKDWYDPRFIKMFRNFQRLMKLGYRLRSVTPNSLLNKIMPSLGIDHLYINSVLLRNGNRVR